MRYLFIFIFIGLTFSYAGLTVTDTGSLPSWLDLNMNEQDYWFLSSFSGLLCGLLFTFLITK